MNRNKKTVEMDESIDGYEKRRRAIRSQILDATVSLIKARGHTDITVREIANRAGVSPATPFNHFKSKDGILGAIVTRSMGEAYSHESAEVGTVVDLFLDITKHYISNEDVYKLVIGAALQSTSRRSRSLLQALSGIRRRIELQIQRGQLASHALPSVLAEQLETFWIGSVILWSGGTISSDEWRMRVELGVELILYGFYPDGSRAKSTRKLARLQKQISPISSS
jgi:AcrR family transcriptional regulator